MKIVIDCRTILNPGFGEGAGVGHYTYYLVSHLLRLDAENEYVLFFDRRLSEEAIGALIGNRPRTSYRFFPFHKYREYLPGFYQHLLVAAAFSKERPDIFHIPGGNIPAAYRGKTVLTVHDLAMYRHPEWFPSRPIATRFLYPQSLRRASRLIVPSLSVASDLRELFRIHEGRVSVVPEGVDAHTPLYDQDIVSPEDVVDRGDLERKYKIRSPYVLSLGTLEPRKNLEMFIRAFGDFCDRGQGIKVQLVLAGARGWKYEGIFRAIGEVNRRHPFVVQYIGYIPHRDKWAFMRHAECFAYPSLYEGFGLPPLEAMSCGTPVICSSASSLPEVVESAGILVAPDQPEEWARAMERVLKNKPLREELALQGKTQSQKFAWSRTAELTLEAYHKTRS
ncbi:MAG: glycosyltransferase family 1 protein [Patescibacteria group bacterium]